MPPSTSQFAFRIVGALEEDCDGTGAASGVAAGERGDLLRAPLEGDAAGGWSGAIACS